MNNCVGKNELFRTIRDIDRARKTLGLIDRDIKYLDYAARKVSTQDCVNGATPCYYGRVDDMAHELDVLPRTVNNCERRLEKAGLIVRNLLGNGHRRPRGGFNGRERKAHGISLAPLIERRDELAKKAEVVKAENRRFMDARESVLHARGRLIAAIKGAAGYLTLKELRDHSQATLDAHPDRIARELHEVDELQRMALVLLSAADALDTAVDNFDVSTPEENEISDASEIDCRHKYNTNPKPLYSCSDIMRTPPNGGDSRFSQTRSDERYCIESKSRSSRSGHNPEIHFDTDNFAISKVAKTLPDEWRVHLGPCSVVWDVLPDLAEIIVPSLGIANHLWIKARREIGPVAAAVAVLLVDRNRDHPKFPVRSPGGALTRMLEKAPIGKLNLEGSLHGLIDRSTTQEHSRA